MNREIVPARARTAQRGTQDFALVVGVDDYPLFRGLQGAVADAMAFHAWVCDPDGGAVSPLYARLIPSAAEPARPVQEQIDAALVELCDEADAVGGGRRLYLYFAGHGAMCTDSGDDVALLLATWSLDHSRLALSSNSYRSALSSLGSFSELVLFLDCCRTTAAHAVGMPPTFALVPRLPGSTRTFIAYATEAGHSAFEHSEGGTWRGVFTRSLLAVLGRAQYGIDAAHLKSLLEHEARMVGQRAHIVDGLLPGSIFGQCGEAPLLDIVPHDEQGEFYLYDGFGRAVGYHPAASGRWTSQLPPALYKLVYEERVLDDGHAEDLSEVKRVQMLIDHVAATRLDFRPRLKDPRVRTWTTHDTDRTISATQNMSELLLGTRSLELALGLCVNSEDGCYKIEASHDGLWYHGRYDSLHRKGLSRGGTRVRARQLRDGDVFRCGTLRILVGAVASDAEPERGVSLLDWDRLSQYTFRSHRNEQPDPLRGLAWPVSLDSWQPDVALAQRPLGLLVVKAAADISMTVYDAEGREVVRRDGSFARRMPRGLYRIDSELGSVAASRVIELGEGILKIPIVFSSAINSVSYQHEAAKPYIRAARLTIMGAGPQTSRLIVFVQDYNSAESGGLLRSVSVRDLQGELLADVSDVATRFGSYLVMGRDISPGTYILRAGHDIAVTIPEGYAASVFVENTRMRIALTPVGHVPSEPPRAMEHIVATGHIPPGVVGLVRSRATNDLCLTLAAAHAMAGDDRAALIASLAPFSDVPDVAILRGRLPFAPPLLRASLRHALTDPAFDLGGLDSESPLARASCSATGDPFWASWDPTDGGSRWIAPTIAGMPPTCDRDLVTLARRFAVPPACLES